MIACFRPEPALHWGRSSNLFIFAQGIEKNSVPYSLPLLLATISGSCPSFQTALSSTTELPSVTFQVLDLSETGSRFQLKAGVPGVGPGHVFYFQSTSLS